MKISIGTLVRGPVWPPRRSSPTAQASASSTHTRNPASVFGPKLCVSGTSAASRPRAIRIRPTRGALLR